jgi:hypothetical protein
VKTLPRRTKAIDASLWAGRSDGLVPTLAGESRVDGGGGVADTSALFPAEMGGSRSTLTEPSMLEFDALCRRWRALSSASFNPAIFITARSSMLFARAAVFHRRQITP